MARSVLRIDGTKFRDSFNREVTFRGINVAGDSKQPRHPDIPSHRLDSFFDGDNVSFVGRPFTAEEAHSHFARLKRWGYNTIRYLFTWEAIEHAGPGKYDEDFINHTIEILRIAKSYGLYAFMDPHQDVWSRFSGGSGSPLWTLYACGFNPKGFQATQAAFVQNTYHDPSKYPKMLWSTNYHRLVSQTMFALFFAGKDFAPKAIIDGKNIQDYLQDHYIAACKHLARRIHEAGDLEDECVIGWESWNEPSRGNIGYVDLSVLPADQALRKGTTPTGWQSILTGSGRALEVDVYDVGSFGPYKSGRELVDPQGASAWLPASYDDTKYGWKRDSNWKLGECLWAQHGVWDPTNDKLLKKDYFAKFPKTGQIITYEKFTNTYFMDHFRAFRDAIRSIHKVAMLFCQPPVNEIPPSLKGTPDDDPRIIFAAHYYDGLTLLTKHWNPYFNVDVFGVMRGKYLIPAFAIKIGETAIRNCLRDQLSAIREEGLDYTGIHPCVFTEIGIPYDMDDKKAYKDGNYSSQIAAMDANHFALEGSGAAGFTLWTYVATNNHEWGDQWNGEDLSIYSTDDKVLDAQSSHERNASKVSVGRGSPSFSESQSNRSTLVNPSNISGTLEPPSMKTPASVTTVAVENTKSDLRAGEAFVRPSPVATNGSIIKYGFDLRNCVFTFSLEADEPTKEEAPTEIFLPDFHFPPSNTTVQVSGGKWTINAEMVDGETMQMLRWWHGPGEQKITIKGLKGGRQVFGDADEDIGYMEQCRRMLMKMTGMGG